MPTFSKTKLSASTDGRAVKVAATATPGTTIHTGSSSAGVLHEIWLYAVNSDTSPHKLTIEWGGTTAPDDTIEVTVPLEGGLMLVSPGLLIVGNATPLIVKAFADTTNLVLIHGFVNVIT
jgi:hypothetical protein